MEHKALKVLAVLVAVIVVLLFICFVIVVTLVLTKKDDSSVRSSINFVVHCSNCIDQKENIEKKKNFEEKNIN